MGIVFRHHIEAIFTHVTVHVIEPELIGTNGSSDWAGNNAQSSYYTYQCATRAGVCSFVAPASLRSSSLRAGARCSCSDGLSQGQIK
jgi:hypothetical protein